MAVSEIVCFVETLFTAVGVTEIHALDDCVADTEFVDDAESVEVIVNERSGVAVKLGVRVGDCVDSAV